MAAKQKKIFNFDVEVLKERIEAAKQAAVDKVTEGRNLAIGGLLGKGIELSKKQLGALEKAKKKF
jgi:hypothetical protein